MIAKQKRELMNLPVSPLPNSNMNIPNSFIKKEKGYGGDYETTYKNYIYNAEVIDNILIFTMYKPDGNMIFRQFQDKTSFFTQKAENNKASSARLRYLLDFELGYYSFKIEVLGADDIINGFLQKRDMYFNLDKNGNGINNLEKYQNDLKKLELKNKHDKIRKSIDDEMLEIREVPKDLLKWIDRAPMKHSRYIFYDYAANKKIMNGFCTHCKNDIQIEKPKHNSFGKCPKCHSNVKLIAKGKFNNTSGFTDDTKISYIQTTKNGYCIREFDVSKKYSPNDRYKTADYYLHECKRIFFEKEFGTYGDYKIKNSFEWGNFRQTDEYRFCRDYHTSLSKSYIYPYNLEKIADKIDGLKYAQISNIAKLCGKLNPIELFKKPQKYKWLEYIFKLKFYNLTNDIINYGFDYEGPIDANGKNLKEILKIDKEDIPMIQTINPNRSDLELYRSIKQYEGIKDIVKTVINIKDTLKGNSLEIIKMLKFTKANKIISYLLKQLEIIKLTESNEYCSYVYYEYSESNRLSRILRDWQDYLKECMKLKYDITDSMILFPHDLSAAHERTSGLVEIEKNKTHDKNIKARYSKLCRQFKFETDELIIRPVKNIEELIEEGRELHHCVGGYAESHALGMTTILVIRNIIEPDKPYYTLEYQNDKIQQCRGLKNISATKEINEFLKKWETSKLQKKTGKKADKKTA